MILLLWLNRIKYTRFVDVSSYFLKKLAVDLHVMYGVDFRIRMSLPKQIFSSDQVQVLNFSQIFFVLCLVGKISCFINVVGDCNIPTILNGRITSMNNFASFSIGEIITFRCDKFYSFFGGEKSTNISCDTPKHIPLMECCKFVFQFSSNDFVPI